MDPVTLVIIGIVALLLLGGGLSNVFAASPATYCCKPCCYEGTCLGCYPQGVKNFAGAIAFAEGYWDAQAIIIPNSRPARNNNPGDIMGKGDLGSDSSGYAVFSTSQLGFGRLYDQLNRIIEGRSAFYTLTMTIQQMADRWTTTQQTAWAQNVAAWLGGSPTDTIGTYL